MKIPLLARLSLAAVVAGLAVSTTTQAVQTANTPNAAFIKWTLAPNASTISYKPIASVPTLVMAGVHDSPYPGVAQVTVQRVVNDDKYPNLPKDFLGWVGQNSFGSYPDSIKSTGGIAAAAGTTILRLDWYGSVHLKVGDGGNTLRITNGSPHTISGNMTWIW